MWVRNKRTGVVWLIDDGTEQLTYLLSQPTEYEPATAPVAEAQAEAPPEMPLERTEKAERPPRPSKAGR